VWAEGREALHAQVSTERGDDNTRTGAGGVGERAEGIGR
jgi:hypothetical protein